MAGIDSATGGEDDSTGPTGLGPSTGTGAAAGAGGAAGAGAGAGAGETPPGAAGTLLEMAGVSDALALGAEFAAGVLMAAGAAAGADPQAVTTSRMTAASSEVPVSRRDDIVGAFRSGRRDEVVGAGRNRAGSARGRWGLPTDSVRVVIGSPRCGYAIGCSVKRPCRAGCNPARQSVPIATSGRWRPEVTIRSFTAERTCGAGRRSPLRRRWRAELLPRHRFRRCGWSHRQRWSHHRCWPRRWARRPSAWR